MLQQMSTHQARTKGHMRIGNFVEAARQVCHVHASLACGSVTRLSRRV